MITENGAGLTAANPSHVQLILYMQEQITNRDSLQLKQMLSVKHHSTDSDQSALMKDRDLHKRYYILQSDSKRCFLLRTCAVLTEECHRLEELSAKGSSSVFATN